MTVPQIFIIGFFSGLFFGTVVVFLPALLHRR